MAKARVTLSETFISPHRTFEAKIKLQMLEGAARMGNSSFVLKHTRGVLFSPVAVEIHRAYSYDPKSTKGQMYFTPHLLIIANLTRTILQIRHQGGSLANPIDDCVIARIKWTCASESLEIGWDVENSAIVEPDYSTVDTVWEGGFYR